MKKCLFVLLGLTAIALSSCVQDDMYEWYEDELDGGFVRKKKSKDYGNWPAPSGINYPTSGANIPNSITPSEELQRQWIINMVNNNPEPFLYECFTYALYNYSGSGSLLEMRQKIGRDVFNNKSNWQLDYYDYVVNKGGLPTLRDGLNEYEYEDQLVEEYTGAKRMEDNEWQDFYRDNMYNANVSEKIIVMVHDRYGKPHAGLIKSISGTKISLIDQYGLDVHRKQNPNGENIYTINQVQSCYRQRK